MRCTKCEFENPAGMKFCGKCRTALGVTCPNCSFENPPGFDFCGQCAAALQEDTRIERAKLSAPAKPAAVRVTAEQAIRPRSRGERKTVTALFADIKGSTELEQDLDPEDRPCDDDEPALPDQCRRGGMVSRGLVLEEARRGATIATLCLTSTWAGILPIKRRARVESPKGSVVLVQGCDH